MSRLMTEEEMKEIKADKRLRDKIRAELEKQAEIGKLELHSVDRPQIWAKMSQRVATEDAIIRFCADLDIYNPLYHNKDYARNSIYGGLVAPPHFLNAISRFTNALMLKEFQSEYIMVAIDAGIDAEWFKVIREGDEFSVYEVQTEVVDLTREDTGLQFLARSKKVYKNQRDEVIAIISPSVIVIPDFTPNKMPEGIQRRQPKIRHFSEQEVEEWYQLMLQEPIRGSNPRYWEDVNVGDQLPPLHQVYSTMDYIHFIRSCGYEVVGCWRIQMDRSRQRRLGWKAAIDPESGLPDFASIHLQDTAAQRLHGLPRAVAPGAQMTSWLCTMVTNWMGDAGFLKKINHQYRRPLWRESLALFEGRVTKKYAQGDEYLVDISTTLKDHNGDLQIPHGTATVVLPSSRGMMEKLAGKK
jgi:acyl dehydratase